MKSITLKHQLLRNPFLIFLPFLMYYVFYVIRHHTDAMIGDESRYYQYAQNLLQGFYASQSDDMYLWNGPGYPVFLMPFVYFKMPLLFITLTNAVLQYLSIVYLFKSIKLLSNNKSALIFSLFWAIAFGAYSHMQSIITESLSYLLVALLSYFIILSFQKRRKINMLFAGFLLGYLALTKIIFGYIVAILFIINLFIWLIKKQNKNYRTGIFISTIALLTIVPYLLYTQSLTGKFFYLGNSGGLSLYWMSTPYENEYGDWNNINFIAGNPALSKPDHQAKLSVHHQKEMNEILQFKKVERDEAFKKAAIKNIKTHPKKYLKNIVYNISRMFFNTPNSYSYKSITKLIWHSGILIFLILAGIFFSVANRKKIDYSIVFLVTIAGLFIGATSLLSADYRLFSPIIPLLLVWIAYAFKKRFEVGQ